jgi:7-cyano-7-deazaguanine synthase in queuosine biosynthesis
MNSLIIESASPNDLKILQDLAERLGLQSKIVDLEIAENIALKNAIKEGMDTPDISREEIFNTLNA